MTDLFKSVIDKTTSVVSSVANATVRRGSATAQSAPDSPQTSKGTSMQDGILLYCEKATCNSLRIAWAIPGEHSVKPGATLELSEYELKYFAANASAISRSTTSFDTQQIC